MSDFIFIVLALLITALLAWFIGYLCTRGKINKLQAERDDIYDKLNESEGKTRFLMSEKQKLEGDNETLSLKVGDLRIQSENLDKELKSVNAEKLGLLGQIDSLKPYQSQYEQTSTQLKDTEGRLNALQIDYKNLQGEHKNVNDNLQKQLAQVATLTSSVAVLNAVKNKFNILEPRAERMEKDIAELQAKLKQSNEANASLNETIKENDALLLGLRADLDGKQASLDAALGRKKTV